jgi:hypothetical protein
MTSSELVKVLVENMVVDLKDIDSTKLLELYCKHLNEESTIVIPNIQCSELPNRSVEAGLNAIKNAREI